MLLFLSSTNNIGNLNKLCYTNIKERKKKMIDFTNAVEEFNNYKGSEKKKTLIYDNKKYLVKFPNPIKNNYKNTSYINNTFSEYIGSNIFKIIGFKTQNTILGTYKYKQKIKIVCACEDFTDNENVLYEFEDEEIKNINETELKNLAINSYSCLKQNGKKINYMSFIKKMDNIECNNAIKRIFPSININEIRNFIDTIECISNIRKDFYKNIIEIRYNIIKNIYENLIK